MPWGIHELRLMPDTALVTLLVAYGANLTAHSHSQGTHCESFDHGGIAAVQSIQRERAHHKIIQILAEVPP